MVLHLTQSWCGCSLRTGSLILGVMGAIGALFSLVASLVVVAMVYGYAAKNETMMYDTTVDMPFFGEDTTVSMKGVIILLIVYAFISAILLVVNIMLVFGASAGKPKLIKPWIVASIILTVLGGIFNLVRVIMLLVSGDIAPAVLVLLISAVGACVSVYYILVVNSLHTELISQQFPNKMSFSYVSP